ncbi:Protein free1 [Dionaea muscipula]
MQQGDYSSSYYPYPQQPPPMHPPPLTPNLASPSDHQPPPSAYASASAPPFSATSYSSSDYPVYPHNYPQFPQNPDPVPLSSPTAPPPYHSLPPPTVNPNPQPPPPLPVPPQPQPSYAPGLPQYPPYDTIGQPPSTYPHPGPSPPAPSSPYVNSNVNYPVPYSNVNSSAYDSHPYEGGKSIFDHGSGYFDDDLGGGYGGGYGSSRPDLGVDVYGKRPESSRYDTGTYGDVGYGDGVYAYQGKTEPYGARGTAAKSSTWSGMFDDYGRAVSLPSDKEKSSSLKVVRAVPKADVQADVKSGVQKFKVKVLPESRGQGVMDILCQVGLDGIRMLDPSTSRTLRIYPLETVSRCEKIDSSTFAFWSKTSVDIEPRRIRIQSNSYTTNTMLDTVTAAVVQFKEMGGRNRPDASKVAERPAEKKKGFGDWMYKLKPANEERDHWVPDEAVSKCTACGTDFSAFVRKHHCRYCGDIFCDKCTQGRVSLAAEENAPPVRVCDRCMASVTPRLSNAKATASKPALQSHEDLAKKLQDEMEKNRKASAGSTSDGAGRRMKEVACPTCTVHLQVQVPTSGTETIECGVCQHPFLVSAH